MEYFNEMEVVFDSRSENEGFARVAVAAFMTQMDPVLEEVADVKTAVSEAVTNSIIHGYEGRTSAGLHLFSRRRAVSARYLPFPDEAQPGWGVCLWLPELHPHSVPLLRLPF